MGRWVPLKDGHGLRGLREAQNFLKILLNDAGVDYNPDKDTWHGIVIKHPNNDMTEPSSIEVVDGMISLIDDATGGRSDTCSVRGIGPLSPDGYDSALYVEDGTLRLTKKYAQGQMRGVVN